ncbi:MAG: hypothetical protein SCH66_14660 [Methanolobus sp.]|nr:hypothetical protein [Methanolobus sp.]
MVTNASIISLGHRKRTIKGKVLSKMIQAFDEEPYHNRDLIETMFLTQKKCEEKIKARKYWNPINFQEI